MLFTEVILESLARWVVSLCVRQQSSSIIKTQACVGEPIDWIFIIFVSPSFLSRFRNHTQFSLSLCLYVSAESEKKWKFSRYHLERKPQSIEECPNWFRLFIVFDHHLARPYKATRHVDNIFFISIFDSVYNFYVRQEALHRRALMFDNQFQLDDMFFHRKTDVVRVKSSLELEMERILPSPLGRIWIWNSGKLSHLDIFFDFHVPLRVCKKVHVVMDENENGKDETKKIFFFFSA